MRQAVHLRAVPGPAEDPVHVVEERGSVGAARDLDVEGADRGVPAEQAAEEASSALLLVRVCGDVELHHGVGVAAARAPAVHLDPDDLVHGKQHHGRVAVAAAQVAGLQAEEEGSLAGRKGAGSAGLFLERTLFSVWMPPSNMVKSRVFQLMLQHMVCGAALSSWIFSPKTATLGTPRRSGQIAGGG